MTFSDPAKGGVFVEGLLRKFLMGAALPSAIALYVYELLQKNPDRGFGLLLQFGPGFLLSIVAMVVGWDLAKAALAKIGNLADSMQTLSVAVAKIAEKDDRQYEEMRRLSQFAAQQAERNFEILREHRDVLAHIESALARTG